MVSTTDTYVKVGTKWELQNVLTTQDTNASRSPSSLGTTSGGYPRKANYFWLVMQDVWNSRRSGYGSGDAKLDIKIWLQQNNGGDAGGNDQHFSWRRLSMNTSNHGDDADKEINGYYMGSSNTSSVQFICHGFNGQNWEASNQNSKVHDAQHIFHVMRGGAGDGSGNAPEVFKLIGYSASGYEVGAGYACIQNVGGGNQENQSSNSVLISPPSVPVYTYPNLTNGTIYEESGTGKHYMFDGTDTWNEMPVYG